MEPWRAYFLQEQRSSEEQGLGSRKWEVIGIDFPVDIYEPVFYK